MLVEWSAETIVMRFRSYSNQSLFDFDHICVVFVLLIPYLLETSHIHSFSVIIVVISDVRFISIGVAI